MDKAGTHFLLYEISKIFNMYFYLSPKSEDNLFFRARFYREKGHHRASFEVQMTRV